MKRSKSKSHCLPADRALKTFFLGPASENADLVTTAMNSILNHWFELRKSQFTSDGGCITEEDRNGSWYQKKQKRIHEASNEILALFEKEIPKHTPRYLGHMSSEISIPGFIGQFIGTIHNPNLISSEVAKAGSEIEDQAIRILLKVVGFVPNKGMGHFTSGGTIANFEAIERAKLRAQKHSMASPLVFVPENRHYSWDKGFSIFGIEPESVWKIELDEYASLSLVDFAKKLKLAEKLNRPIMMVVSVAGSTEFGGIDPIDRIQRLLQQHERKTKDKVWHHVDAAYGGFFRTLLKLKKTPLTSEQIKSLTAIKYADSVTIDPHKLGYVPYSSGVFLTQRKADYTLTAVTAPYLNYEQKIDRGLYTLEGSRPVGGATATLLTEKCLGFDHHGLGKIIAKTVQNRKDFEQYLRKIPNLVLLPGKKTNVICFYLRATDRSWKTSSQLTKLFYDRYQGAAENRFYVSKTSLYPTVHRRIFQKLKAGQPMKGEIDSLVCIRLCLMNPFLGSHEFKVNFYEEFSKLVKSFLKANKN
jgi:glutamate/tyrosine decarboxylase-like PLP-dependent enzyme